MNRQERAEYLETQIDESIELLEAEIAAGVTENFLELLEFKSRLPRYSLANCILILLQKPDAAYCAGMSTWNKMGYKVRKGEKAIWIRCPFIVKQVNPETGELEKKLVGFGATTTFDISQVEGDKPIPDFTRPFEGDWELAYQTARVHIGATGILCDEEALPTGLHGLSFGGRIVVNPSLSSGEKFVCLLHELVHEVLHQDEDRTSLSDRQLELEAEAGAFILARLYGLTNQYSKDYIQSWKGTVERLHESLTRITLAVRQCVEILHLDKLEEVETAADAA